LFHVMGALAEFERALISERTRAGMAAACVRGSKLGRPRRLSLQEIEAVRIALRDNCATLSELARRMQVPRATLARAISSTAVRNITGLTERAEATGIEALGLSPRMGDFNEDLRAFGLGEFRAALHIQLAPQDVVRFMPLR
jgi:predicted DNA-binding protein (UPF0251 family)